MKTPNKQIKLSNEELDIIDVSLAKQPTKKYSETNTIVDSD